MNRGLILLLAIVATATGNAAVPTSRIVDGTDAKIEDFPYQVLVARDGEFYCGGSIIKPRFVLSAAHCVFNSKPDLYTVQYGSSKIDGEGGTTVQVGDLIVHKDYNYITLDYDIALLRLVEEIVFSRRARPIALTEKAPPAGTKVTVTGWGRNSILGQVQDILQKANIFIVAHDVCEKDYANFNLRITDRMICAGISGSKKGHCKGDSGGPLVANNELVGVVSWRVQCEHSDVYADVSFLRSWISSNIE